jgi:beta-galactosidase beta subunit
MGAGQNFTGQNFTGHNFTGQKFYKQFDKGQFAIFFPQYIHSNICLNDSNIRFLQ